VSIGVRLFPAVRGHIADSVRAPEGRVEPVALVCAGRPTTMGEGHWLRARLDQRRGCLAVNPAGAPGGSEAGNAYESGCFACLVLASAGS
jgi:hypothetical protein